ncbi:transposase, partial [Maribacter sp. 2307ULW6-5]|uniref:transposase n=1 Tax=Maribacter sp. 2307ULW6-5 TaxID=3386275 RepID=UPI0039BC6AA9
AAGMFPDMPDPYPSRFPLSRRDQRIYWVLQLLYDQQKHMYDEKVHSVADRIVNIHQPYVRPIPRGKDRVSTEFGAKISSSETGGMARTEHISWDNFNESKDLELQVKAYRKTHGRWPELLLADRIYLNRENRKWLKEKGIRIVGVPLGRPPKEELTAYQKRKRKKERNQRNHIEGKFGQGKNAYGLGDIRAKRRDTSESWIGAIFFVMNLVALAKIADIHAIFCALFKKVFRCGTYPGVIKGLLSKVFAPIGNGGRNAPRIVAA